MCSLVLCLHQEGLVHVFVSFMSSSRRSSSCVR